MSTRPVDRRRFLVTVCGAAVAGCSTGSAANPGGPDATTGLDGAGPPGPDGNAPPDTGGPDAAPSCATKPQSPVTVGGCTIHRQVVTVPGGATLLQPGQVALMQFDEDSGQGSLGVFVVRDALGIYALSAVCTHQCNPVYVCDQVCPSFKAGGNACAVPVPAPLPNGDAGDGGTLPAFRCPSHDSQYAADGTVVRAHDGTPPNQQNALPWLLVTFSGGDLLVDMSQAVALGTRIQPPSGDAGADADASLDADTGGG